MYKADAVQLRLALFAAAACVVLAAAASNGAHQAGPPSIAMDPKSAPILVKSISTIRNPSVEKSRAPQERVVTVVAAFGEARANKAAVLAATLAFAEQLGAAGAAPARRGDASAIGLCSRQMMAGREPATAALGGLSGFPLTMLAATSNE
jgi:hypothetical protein